VKVFMFEPGETICKVQVSNTFVLCGLVEMIKVEDCFDFLVLFEFICLMNKIEQKVHETQK